MPSIKDPLLIALNFLRYRARTTFEISKKLKEKGIDDAEIKKTVQFLKKNQFLDDRRFAASWIRARSLLHPSGRYRLTQELLKLGLSKDLIDEVWQNLQSEDAGLTDELKLATEAGKRKISVYRRLPEDIFRRRLLAFLMRRGFSYHIAKSALVALSKKR